MRRIPRIVAALLVLTIMANCVSSFAFRVSGSRLTRNSEPETRNADFDVVALAPAQAGSPRYALDSTAIAGPRILGIVTTGALGSSIPQMLAEAFQVAPVDVIPKAGNRSA